MKNLKKEIIVMKMDRRRFGINLRKYSICLILYIYVIRIWKCVYFVFFGDWNFKFLFLLIFNEGLSMYYRL